MNNITTNYWNNVYDNNVGDNNIVMNPTTFFEYIKRYIKEDFKGIEFGCGNGRDAINFSKIIKNYVGIDLCEKAINICNNNNTHSVINNNSIFINDSFCDDNLINKYNLINDFDFVYSRFTLHSIDDNLVLKAIKNAYNLLKINGYLFIETRSTNDPRFNVGEKVGKNAFIDTHYRRFTELNEMIEILENNNFKIISICEEFRDAWFNDDKAVVLRVIAIKK
jgi:tellurite methyltransferase